MSPSRAVYVAFLSACIAVMSAAAVNVPPIGAGSRFQTEALAPGWHRGFFNQTRTAPPCYILITFEARSSPDKPLRIERTIAIARVQRLQVTAAPGTSMQQWSSLVLPAVPENSWREVELAPLRPSKGQCRVEDPLGS